MKIAFIASLTGKATHQFHYLAIIDLLEGLGHTVLHRHITQSDSKQISQSETLNTQFHQKVFRAIKSADLVVAEISHQSIGVGYVISEALKMARPIITLTSSTLPPTTIYLEDHESLITYQYTSIRELETKLPFLLAQSEPKKEKKFNFFLPSELNDYLYHAANQNHRSKSEYLRQLLENDQKHPL